MVNFERMWLSKLSTCLDETAGEGIRREVMRGSEALSSEPSPERIIEWTREAMDRLDALVDEDTKRQVLTGCACQYPKADLRQIREEYEASGDIEAAHRMLQERFLVFLRDVLGLSEDLVQEVVGRGWGLAGELQGDRIIATKIPKSGFLVEYMNETDPERRRQIYCHCPRVRDAVRLSEPISPTYCYCGAGYYQGIWEEILQAPVRVELLKSVLQGDDVCAVAVHLPQNL